MHFILALLIPLFAHAEPPSIDLWGRDNLAWKNPELAGDLSDYNLGFHVLGTVTYTILHNKGDKPLEKTLAVVGNYGAAYLINAGVKHWIARCRPDGSDCLSMYSGHTAIAFLGAGMVCAQGDETACIVAIATALPVPLLRIGAKKHWITDTAVAIPVAYGQGRYGILLVVDFKP